jgi:hypothetical protein
MAYDEELANRIRTILTGTPGLTEKKMFGGLGFMINGRAAGSAYKGGDLMIRCAKDDWAGFIEEEGDRAMERGGKPVSGWVLIDNDAVADDADLEKWVGRGRDHAASQPPK